MKKRLSLISFLLALSCLFNLAGCGDTAAPVSSNSPSATSSVQAEAPDKPAESPTSSASPRPSDTPAPSDDSTFSIHFIDVGQADAALVECDGHYMLIDGGNKEDSNVIYSVLKQAEVPRLDIVVGTHAHEDHIGGLPGAFNYTQADLTLCPVTDYDSKAFENFKQYAEQKGGGIVIPSVGDTYTLGSAAIEILAVNSESDTNNTSIVLMITYGETKFLFTGDAEREAEQVILNSGADLSATVLKVGHHGSSTSTSYLFLREIMPAYAVISVGTGNTYGHPTEDALSRLRDADVKVFRTDLQGDVMCTSDGKTVNFSVARNGDANTLGTAAKPQASSTPTPTPAPTPTPTPTPTPSSDPIPDGDHYVLNTSSKKFHSPTCSSADKISSANREYSTESAEKLVAQGYDPCGICKPYEVPAPSSSREPEPTQSETMVWIPGSGTKYHSSAACSNMKNPTQVTKTQAETKGFTACKKCW